MGEGSEAALAPDASVPDARACTGPRAGPEARDRLALSLAPSRHLEAAGLAARRW